MAKWNGKIPFWKSDGTLIDYDGDTHRDTRFSWTPQNGGQHIKDEVEWRENFVFEDKLIYDGYYKGRSAVGVTLRSIKTGATYALMMQDFDDLMKTGQFNGATIEGKFTFVKRGANYRIVPADKVKKCKHCGHSRKDHVNDRCLFDSSSYELEGEVQKVA